MTQLGGSFLFVQLPAVTQLLAELGSTGRLCVTHAEWTGEIVVHEGKIVEARLGAEHGRAALEGIAVALSDGEFSFVDEPVAPVAADASSEALVTADERGAYLDRLGAEHQRQRGMARTLRDVALLMEGGLVKLEPAPSMASPEPVFDRPVVDKLAGVQSAPVQPVSLRQSGRTRSLRDCPSRGGSRLPLRCNRNNSNHTLVRRSVRMHQHSPWSGPLQLPAAPSHEQSCRPEWLPAWRRRCSSSRNRPRVHHRPHHSSRYPSPRGVRQSWASSCTTSRGKPPERLVRVRKSAGNGYAYSMRTVLRIIGFIIGGLVALVVILVAGVYLNLVRLRMTQYSNPVPAVTVARTPDQVARGQYMVTALPGCAGCHSSNASASPPILDGGHIGDIDALGNFNAPNLTPGGPSKDWTDGQVIRAIREGIDKDGHPLALMPAPDYHNMSDDDVQAVVAYLRTRPAAQKDSPGVSFGFLGTMLTSTGQFPLANQPPAGAVTAPPRGPTAAYGKYLVSITGCATCHGPALDAQNIPRGPPPGPNLRIVKSWTEPDFLAKLRTGVDPAKHQLGDAMPWRQFGQGTDDDLRAIYQYVTSLQ